METKPQVTTQGLVNGRASLRPWIKNFNQCWTLSNVPDIRTAIKSQTPAIRDIPNIFGAEQGVVVVVGVLGKMLNHVKSFFNVGKNMTDAQIGTTVQLLIARYPHFSFEDFRSCLLNAMASAKLYDRLDGNIIIGWLDAYDKERDEALLNLYEEQDRSLYQSTESADGIAYDEFYAELRKKAADGDRESMELLEKIRRINENTTSSGSAERLKKIAFRRRYLTEYLPRK